MPGERHRRTTSDAHRSPSPATARCPSCPTSPTSRRRAGDGADRRPRRSTRSARTRRTSSPRSRGCGIAEEDIQTSGLSLWPTFGNDGREITGYQASTNVTSPIRDVEAVGAVVDALKGFVGEELTLGGISFSYDDPEAVLGEARTAAIDNARDPGRAVRRGRRRRGRRDPADRRGLGAADADPARRRLRRRRGGRGRRSPSSPAPRTSPPTSPSSSPWADRYCRAAMALPSPQRAVASASALARAALRPERPDRLPRAASRMAAWGPTMAGAVAAATARYPLAPAVIDEEGRLSYADLWAATDGVARGLRARGVGPSQHRRHPRPQPSWVRHRPSSPPPSSAPTSSTSTPASPRRSWPTSSPTRASTPCSTTTSSPPIVDGCGASIRLTGSELDALADRAVVPAAAADAADRPSGHPHVGHDGPAEGRGTIDGRRRRRAHPAARDDPDPRP